MLASSLGQAITRFKNDIKTGRKRTHTFSIWLGSKKPPEEILDACAQEWEEEQENGGLVRIVFKQTQSLSTSWKIGVPTDVNSEALQMKMHNKIEEACQKMVAHNLFKYGMITKVPKFVLEKNFIKNMPYAE